jgi:hypothetical protein
LAIQRQEGKRKKQQNKKNQMSHWCVFVCLSVS